MMNAITPFLWFSEQAEEAVNYYISVFEDGRIHHMTRYDEFGAQAAGRPAGSVMTIDFEINGQRFTALNGGPHFQFNEAVSFVVHCDTQDQLDRYWNALSDDPKNEQCGWCKDKFGLSWQIIPSFLGEMMADKDPKKSKAVMAEVLNMKKLDIDVLKHAFDQA